jgi:hypothetical protein
MLIRPLITAVDVNKSASAWLFPGYVPLTLAAIAVIRGRQPVGVDDQPGRPAWVRVALLVEIALLVSVAGAVAVSVWAPIHLRMTDTLVVTARTAGRAWAISGALVAIRWLMLGRAPFDLSARRRLLARWAAVRRADPVPLYLLIAIFCAWVAFGPPSRFWRLGLWRLIYDWPVLNFVRATARFMVLGLLAVAVLAGIGFDRLAARRGPAATRTLAIAASVLLLLEFTMLPMRVFPYRVDVPAADRWLADQPKPFVVAEVPISETLQGKYMLHSTAHWQKTIHGNARIVPPASEQLFEELVHFPDEPSVRRLEEFGVTYVVVHISFYRPEERAAIEERLQAFSGRLTLAYSDADSRVYLLRREREAGLRELFCQASVIASPTVSSSAASSRTVVHPWRPHAPLAGANEAGFARMNSSCCAGVSFTMPCRPSG